MASGVFDGIMLNCWHDDEDRLGLAKVIRKVIGDDALILVNANDRRTPNPAAYANGLFMECYKSECVSDWKQIAETLLWAERNLKEPRTELQPAEAGSSSDMPAAPLITPPSPIDSRSISAGGRAPSYAGIRGAAQTDLGQHLAAEIHRRELIFGQGIAFVGQRVVVRVSLPRASRSGGPL